MFDRKLCAFIDILGFKEAVLRADQDSDFAEKLKYTLAIINASSDALNKSGLRDGVEYALQLNLNTKEPVSVPLKSSEFIKSTSFSDSLVISCDLEHRHCFNFVLSITLLLHNLLQLGVLARGAISVGNLHHTPDAVFGRALVDSYVLESKVSIFPRICISDDALEEIKAVEMQPNEISGFFIRDFDGMSMLDYLGKPCLCLAAHADAEQEWVSQRDYRRKLATRIDITGTSIKSIIDSASPRDYGVLSKYRWLVSYYNQAMSHMEYYLPEKIDEPSIT